MTIPLYELPSLLHAWHARFTLLRPETPCLIAPWLPFVLALCLCVVVFALARRARTLLWAPVCGLIGTAPLLLGIYYLTSMTQSGEEARIAAETVLYMLWLPWMLYLPWAVLLAALAGMTPVKSLRKNTHFLFHMLTTLELI